MHTIGERDVQITKAIEEKSKRGPVYNRRFLGGDCRSFDTRSKASIDLVASAIKPGRRSLS
eukprot:scaffold6694_cov33-Phaeocystis_antarctica.AAC.4